ncbi:MAG: Asp-tRNA(Asn)/Glu-tRNA(Gln) amidotransferase subunit GatA [Ruminococcaceae bacterium]|nr:Asp-tRNA(Asn)/Glu-tRNA(Gln) amidotransferase subunit GatA [Oscillospiraceae bacterium]
MLYTLTAHDLSEKLKSREISAAELTKAQLDRIAKAEPEVESLLTVTAEEAIKKAEEVDKKLARGEAVSPLAGIPMAIKDNISTKDVRTTCASKMLYNYVPPYNATVAERLFAADAIMIGKANMDEFAMGSSTENSYFKKTKNPRNTAHVPGGSSGGSAAAVAADEAVFALGSDTGGSIRQPASFCGVVGMKPTYGLVSRYGLIAFASSLDQIGPITKDVRDCATVLSVISGKDAKDSTSLSSDVPDYLGALTGECKGMRIGIPKEYFSDAVDPDVRRAVLDAAKAYEAMGACLVECTLPMLDYALETYYLISSAEASSNLARYDGVRYGFRAEGCKDLEELFLRTRSEGFGQEVKRRIMLGTFVLSSGYYDAYYKKAQKTRTLICRDFARVFENVDCILTPTSPCTAWKFGEKSADPVQMYLADICTVSVNIAGLPALSMPCGTDAAGLPIGVQLIGGRLRDDVILRAAYALEQNGKGGR